MSAARDALTGDSAAAVKFLRSFDADGPWCLTAIEPDRGTETRSFTPGDEREMQRWIEARQNARNLYFHVNRVKGDLTNKAAKADMAEVGALHVDIDFSDHRDERERARILAKLRTFEPPPTVIIETGGGYQAFWLLEKFIGLKSENIPTLEAYNRGLEQALGGDHCHNIDRLMRLPWTTNLPNKKKRDRGRVPALAQIVEANWKRYYDLDRFTPAIGPEREKTSASADRDGSRSGAAFRLGLAANRAGKTFDEFCAIVRDDPQTASWYAEKGIQNDGRELRRIFDKTTSGTGDPPIIRIVTGERPRIVTEAIDALDEATVPFYRRSLSIVHVAVIPAKASDGSSIMTPAIVTVPAQQLTHELGKAARWVKYDGRREDWVPADVPADIAAKIAALPNEWRFEPLAGIVGTQTMRPDGSLLVEPGYDEATGFLLFNPPKMPLIPDEPTRKQALVALNKLDELLDEFPFMFDPKNGFTKDANPSRSVALSMMMTPVLRPALPPAVPLHAASAPAPGTGKSYLADLASAIAVGERCPVITKSPSAEETEKRLVGAALTGQPIVSIDNCNGDLRSEFLCQMVERPLLQLRALGSSDTHRIANAVTCFANGNNIQIAEDLVRRTIQCSLDADMERPETRCFKYDPVGEVLEDRGRYVAAVLTIARAYIVAGKPKRPPPFLSFDRWSELVRGSLMWLGCADPVDTVADLAVADPVKNERGEVFTAIAMTMPERAAGHTVAEMISTAEEKSALAEALKMVASADGEISSKRLGKWLAGSQNTIAGGYKLMRNAADSRRVRWQLVPTE